MATHGPLRHPLPPDSLRTQQLTWPPGFQECKGQRQASVSFRLCPSLAELEKEWEALGPRPGGGSARDIQATRFAVVRPLCPGLCQRSADDPRWSPLLLMLFLSSPVRGGEVLLVSKAQDKFDAASPDNMREGCCHT